MLRLYDGIESDRNYHLGSNRRNVVLVLDEGDPPSSTPCWRSSTEEADDIDGAAAERLDDEVVDHWIAKRNDVSQLEPAHRAADWSWTRWRSPDRGRRCPARTTQRSRRVGAVRGTLPRRRTAATATPTAACLYFTFAGKPDPDGRDAYYRAVWDAGTRAVLGAGGSLSHHHGVGLNRARYMGEALGGGLDVLQSLKSALDPTGILNPGKLGLASPFGPGGSH